MGTARFRAMSPLKPRSSAPLPTLRRACFAALALALLLLAGQAAHAHAVLIESVPVDGAVVEQAPREVVLRFNEPVAPAMLRVLDAEDRNSGFPQYDS